MVTFGWRQRLMLASLVLAAYLPTLTTGFMWDDHVMIESNQALTSWSLANLKHDFTSDVFDHHGDAYYRPLQTVMNRIDYTLWGLRPLGFHVTNLLFHLGNTLLAAELALALGAVPLTALIAGTLFAVHPIGVEQLMIIAGRAELMGLFFIFASLLLFLKRTRGATIAGWAAFILGVFSKESCVVTPLALALVYYARREPRSRYRQILPMILLVAPYLWLRHHIVGPVVAEPDSWMTVRFFFQAFPRVIERYVGLILIPWNLHSHRLLPHLTHFWALHLILLSAGCFFLIKRWGRRAMFCIGWFLLMILPKTPVMIYGNFMLDHWAYPASFAVFLALAWGVMWGWQSRREPVRTIAALIYFPLLIGWALMVHLNVALRGTDEKMYRWALNFTTSNPVKYNLAVLLLQTGRPVEAEGYLEEVRIYYPDDPNAINALALAYLRTGNTWLAYDLLKKFAEKHPNDALTRRHLGQLRAALHKK